MTTTNNKQMMMVPVEDLSPWGKNPRKNFDAGKHAETVASVREHGVIQSLLVRELEEEAKYQIVCGERRWRAAVEAGVMYVPVMVVVADDKKAFELAMIENIQRDDLDVFEEAEAYQEMRLMGWDVAGIAASLSLNESTVMRRIHLLELGDEERTAVREKSISIKTGAALAKVDEELRAEALNKIVMPSHHSEPLAQDAALKLIKKDYVDPKQAKLDWESRGRKLAAAYPGAVILPYEEADAARDWMSIYRLASAKPELGMVAKGWLSDADNIPSWGELAAEYGGKLVLVAPEAKGGEEVVMVEYAPVREAEIVQAPVGANVFPKPQSDRSSREEKQANDVAKAEAEASGRARQVQVKELINDLYDTELSADYVKALLALRRKDDLVFADVYEAIHGVRVNHADADDRQIVTSWVDAQIAELGVDGYQWLEMASEVLYELRDDGESELCPSLGLDKAKYDLIFG